MMGILPTWYSPREFGRSCEGVALRCHLPLQGESVRRLVFAGIHGEEPETVILLSRSLRLLDRAPSGTALVLAANPDGLLLGTRGNARGVDLNRNFPSSNWKAEPVFHRSWTEGERCVQLSPGTAAMSEPETEALVRLVDQLNPQVIVSLHAPLGCIDGTPSADGTDSVVSQELSHVFGLPIVHDIGYPTPGSFGSWCADKGIFCVTVELPRKAPEVLAHDHMDAFAHWLSR